MLLQQKRGFMKLNFTNIYGIIGKALCGSAGAIIGFLTGGAIAAVVGVFAGFAVGHLLERAVSPVKKSA
jgi:outer membrane lipoprotein SlyB